MFHLWGFWFELSIGSKYVSFHVPIFLLLNRFALSLPSKRKTWKIENAFCQLKSISSHPQGWKIPFNFSTIKVQSVLKKILKKYSLELKLIKHCQAYDLAPFFLISKLHQNLYYLPKLPSILDWFSLWNRFFFRNIIV